MDSAEFSHQRLYSQRLVGNGFSSAAEVVAHLGAVQSQDYHGAKWAVGQRMQSAADAGLDAAFNAGEILRTHALRPTWHFLTPADIRWILELTAPRVHQLNGLMYRQTELDQETLANAHRVLERELRDGNALTRAEIGKALASDGIEASGIRLGYIMMHAELEQLVCSGPLKGKQHTYALLDERAPAVTPIPREEALGRLATTYFRSHGPATAYDLAWWSGLTIKDARQGAELAAGLEKVDVDGMDWWFSADTVAVQVESPTVHLLPNYDEVFSRDSRRSRYPAADAESKRAESAAERLMVHHIVIEGEWRGGWRRQITAKSVGVEIDPVISLTATEEAGIAAAADRYGAFLGKPVAVT